MHTGFAIVSTHLNGFKDCDLTLIFLFNINQLFAHSELLLTLAFYCLTLIIAFYCLTLIISFNTIHSFAYSQMFKVLLCNINNSKLHAS